MMTSTAKNWLKKTVRELRERLLTDVRAQADSSYKLAIKRADAVLTEEQRKKRVRLEDWLDEQVRAGSRGVKEKDEQARERHLSEAIKLVAATFLNRLVVVCQMETLGLLRSKVMTGGWSSPGYKDFRDFAPEIRHLDGEGFPFLMRLIFDELSLELPGLFGPVGLEELLPVSVAMWRDAVKTLEAKEELSEEDRRGLWQDDTLLGWVYQFWNDPDREALDAKVNAKGKIENHELASKTQLFTDRYMVEWLLQNSLGQHWFAVCQKNGWTPEVVSSGTLDNLEARRAEFREKRERGEVSLEALMPIENELEERWKYWVPRDLSTDGLENIPPTLREMKLLDPACGSGHFLVIAFDLLFALYEEEARHRGESWSAEQIACWILENNLHGMDIDGRAVQIAGAALWLKMKRVAPRAKPERMSLVATDFGLKGLTGDEPEIRAFLAQLEEETGIPGHLLDDLIQALKDADHLGSLLRIDKVLDKATKAVQGTLFDSGNLQETLTKRLADFVRAHADEQDLGVKLRQEGLARSTEFLRLNRERVYDLVVGNPPYQNRSKMADSKFLEKNYKEGKADLYSAFLLRGLEFAKPGGLSTLLTLRGWMFLGTFSALREHLLADHELVALGDLDRGGFEDILDEVVSVAINCFRKGLSSSLTRSVALLPTPRDNKDRDNRRTYRKKAALLTQVGRYEFRAEDLKVVPDQPLVYWWNSEFLQIYSRFGKLSDIAETRVGLRTSDNARYLRRPWELESAATLLTRDDVTAEDWPKLQWCPYIKGAAGVKWFEPASYAVRWQDRALQICVALQYRYNAYPQSSEFYFQKGIAMAAIGAACIGRAHRYRSVFDVMGQSIFPSNMPKMLCLVNTSLAQDVLASLNPSVHFQVGDIDRLPLFPIALAEEIVAQLELSFTEHEQSREASVEFVQPGSSAWTYAQEWAQRAVDRPAGEPLPPYDPVYQEATPEDHFSYAVGLALGRFLPPDLIPSKPPNPGAPISAIANPSKDDLSHALPHGILFLAEHGDSLDHPAAEPMLKAWERHPLSSSLQDYLKNKFFNDIHNNKDRYRPRPIYFPLSSAKKTYVAFISIHRWTDNTLEHLLADYLQPELNRLMGELNDLADARTKGDVKQQSQAQKRYEHVLELSKELQDFADQVRDIAERGAPPVDKKCPPREVDAPFKMNLDDGVMINSAALWPLLESQWKDPKKWWTELCQSQKKDYDWAHLAKRYFPTRVDEKCQKDPSLAVAHGCFWKYHPEKAYEWELRLQDPEELGPSFTLDEENSNELKAQFEAKHPDKARELRDSEEKRRAKNTAKAEKEKTAAEGQLELEI